MIVSSGTVPLCSTWTVLTSQVISLPKGRMISLVTSAVEVFEVSTRAWKLIRAPLTVQLLTIDHETVLRGQGSELSSSRSCSELPHHVKEHSIDLRMDHLMLIFSEREMKQAVNGGSKRSSGGHSTLELVPFIRCPAHQLQTVKN